MSVARAPYQSTPRAGAASALLALALLLAAAAPRLPALGVAPLDPGEASQATAAWWAASGGAEPIASLDPPPTSALLFGLQTTAFWLADSASDALARLVPALAGTGLVLLPLWLRSGTAAGAVSMAVLLGVDPWLVAHSRRASGAMLAVAAAVACHLLLRRGSAASPTAAVEEAARRQWLGWGAAVGLLLASGVSAWDFLPPVLAAAALTASPRGGTGPSSAPRPPPARIVAVAAGTAIAGATGGLLHWHGLGLVPASLDAWLRSWGGAAESAAAASGDGAGAAASGAWGLAALDPVTIVYLLVVGSFGVWGLVRGWRGAGSAPVDPASRRCLEALALWLLWGAVLQLRPGGGPATVLALQVPLLLLAAPGLEGALEAAARRRIGAPAATAAAVAALVAVAAAASGVDGLAGDPRRRTLVPVRRLAGDVAGFEDLPATERPRIEVESAGRIDAVLAWYLRDVAPRWVLGASSVPPDGAPRVVLGRRTRPGADSPGENDERTLYAIGIEGDLVHLVELR